MSDKTDGYLYQPGDKAGKPSGPVNKANYSDKPKRMDFSIADDKGYEQAVAAWEAKQKAKPEKQAEALRKSVN